MGASVEETEVGGGGAQPLGEDFATFLNQALQTGEFANLGVPGSGVSPELQGLIDERDRFAATGIGRSNAGAGILAGMNARIAEASQQQRVGPGAADQTGGIAEALNALVAGPDVSGTQSAVQEIIQRQSGRDVADLRERFTAGGGSQGTPSAVAEGLFRAETAPRLAAATGQLDLAANQQRIQALIPLLQLFGGFGGKGISQRTAGAVVKPGLASDVAGLAQGVGEIVPG